MAVSKPVSAFGYKGMNNLPGEPAKLLDNERRITPKVILNAVVTDDGVLLPRQGFQQKIAKGFHSLWAQSVMLGVGVSDSILYRIDGTTYSPLATIPGPRCRLQYEEVNNLVYISNRYWNGVYDILAGTMRSWGITLPPAPIISMGDGDLPPGTYTLCYTVTANGQLSGNGPLVQVTWEGATRGITLVNLPSNGQCWITHPNGQQLLLAEVSSGVIQGQVPTGEPLPSFMMHPPPKFSDFCFTFGRIWGIRDNRLYYSYPHFPEWFRSSDYWPFLDPLVMIAPANDGIYVSSRESTWYLDGRNPGGSDVSRLTKATMEVGRVGDGAIPGTRAFPLIPAVLAGGSATSQAFATMSEMPTPIMMSPTGFAVGTHTGHITSLTSHRLRITPREQGASLFQVKEGVPQLITVLYGQPVKDEPDEEMVAIFDQGTINLGKFMQPIAGGIEVGGGINVGGVQVG